jgi:hypothetical protein
MMETMYINMQYHGLIHSTGSIKPCREIPFPVILVHDEAYIK